MGKFVIEFDEWDAPMLVHAFAIARNTAMMCGHEKAKERLEQYRKEFTRFVPTISRLFDEETWAEIGMAMVVGGTFTVQFIDRRQRAWYSSPDDEGTITVTIGDRVYKTKSFDTRRHHEQEVVKELSRLAPMDCRHEPVKEAVDS